MKMPKHCALHTMKKSSTTVGLVGGLGNCLWQICGAYACRPEEGHALKFAAYDPAAKESLSKFIRPDRHGAPDSCTAPIGYWQNPKWLLSPATIREHVLCEPVGTHARKEVANFGLIVHVRGGDFLRSPAHNQSRAAQKYVDAALASLLGVRHDDVAIVTDDLQYVAATFGSRYPVLGDHNDARVAFYTLCQAKNLLISPGSTFSWWAAYLGSHDHVLFPAKTWPQDVGALDLDITSCNSGVGLIPKACRRTWTVLDV